MGHQFFNPFPKYLQIREVLARRIDRDMKIGEQLPTEQALCRQFAVSRETVREALRGLEEDGLISRSAGRGTFVLQRSARRPEARLTGLAEDFSALKFNTEARTLEAGPVLPPAGVAESLGVPDDEMMYRIARLRVLDRQPFALHEAFLPLEIGQKIARQDLRKSSIVRELRETLGLDAREDHARVEAVSADTEIAARLDVTIGAPLLLVTRHFLLPRPHGAVLFRTHFRADRYYYTVKLGQRLPRKPRATAVPVRNARSSARPQSARRHAGERKK